MRNIFISFVGNCDPFAKNDEPGPILYYLEHDSNFEKVILFISNVNFLTKAELLTEIIKTKYKNISCQIVEVDIKNPILHNLVYSAMYKSILEVKRKYRDSQFTVCISSGTPTMHACWLLFNLMGVFPAKFTQIVKNEGIKEISLKLDAYDNINEPSLLKAEMTKLKRENDYLSEKCGIAEGSYIANCYAMNVVKKKIDIYANSSISVYLDGESGTGKEVAARELHRKSQRSGEFIPINCGAIPEHLFESEFFGFKKGAFTGADRDMKGKLHLADKGTVFLDEVADLPLYMQVKLLRVLDDGIVSPLGSEKGETLDLRFISASHKDLSELVQQGKFRKDLFYRLVGDTIYLPPLRERQDDILLLANSFLSQCNIKYNTVKIFAPSAKIFISTYNWPGNIRQLKSKVEVAFVNCPDNQINREHFVCSMSKTSQEEQFDLPWEGFSLNAHINKIYETALIRSNNNKALAAKMLDIPQATFRARLRKKNE